MPTDRPPLSRTLAEAITPTLARVVVARMRRMEEERIDAEARWEFLRRQFECIAEDDDG